LLAEARAELARQRGELEEAEARAHVALRSFSEGGLDAWSIDVLDLVAWSAAAHDSFVEAARLFGAAQAARDRLGYPRIPPKQVVHEKDVELARAALGGDAFEEAWAEGAAMSLEDVVAYAERGRGERKRPSSGWASLTPTELEVAGLVADRLTNPQIAEQMFVSRGTVKAHLSHIFAKLGISTRLELADQVAKHQTTS
jgi:DNA-binding CsgD family transcriptional regulator